MGASVHVGVAGGNAAENGATALHLAANGGHAGVVRVLLAAGARVDQGGHRVATALHYAAVKGCMDTLALLPQSPTVAIDRAARSNYTPLHFAIDGDQGKSVQMLIAAGADFAQVDPARRQWPRTASEGSYSWQAVSS